MKKTLKQREIKFRGITETGKWVYGSLHTCVGKTKIGKAVFESGDRKFIEKEVELNESWILKHSMPTDTGWSIADSFQAFNVIPETVGQYTGLKDKNGVEIYEGDVVRHIIESDYLEKEDWSVVDGTVTIIDGCWCVNTSQYPLFSFTNKIIGNLSPDNTKD